MLNEAAYAERGRQCWMRPPMLNEAVPDVLQTNGIGVNSEVWSFSISCSPSYCGIVFKFGYECVDEVGACLFCLLCSEGGQEFLGRIYVDPFLEGVQKICFEAMICCDRDLFSNCGYWWSHSDVWQGHLSWMSRVVRVRLSVDVYSRISL